MILLVLIARFLFYLVLFQNSFILITLNVVIHVVFNYSKNACYAPSLSTPFKEAFINKFPHY